MSTINALRTLGSLFTLQIYCSFRVKSIANIMLRVQHIITTYKNGGVFKNGSLHSDYFYS